jgi:hypothetical protein
MKLKLIMFSLFTVGAKNTNEKLSWEIDELEKVLRLSKKLTNKQIGKMAKYLRKHMPVDRYNLISADIQQALATDETIPSDFNVKSIQVEMRIANFRAGEMVSREKSKKAGITHVSITFTPDMEYCETAQQYRKKYDGKVVKLGNAPIFPLITCYNCNNCTRFVLVKPLIKGLDY